MLKKDIITRVYNAMNEIRHDTIIVDIDQSIVSIYLEEASVQILNIAPVYTINSFVDFSQNTLHPNSDGSGSVLLPDGFLRLVAFRMDSWIKDATQMHDIYDPIYQKQANPYLRGGVTRPILIRDSSRLIYYSVPQGKIHTIERAEAIVKMEVGSNFPETLIDSLVWLTASKVLDIIGESRQADMAREQFAQVFKLLKTS